MWSAFGECSRTCGDGTQERTRSCTNPSPAHGGKECVGNTKESRQCKVKECPGNYAKVLIDYFPIPVFVKTNFSNKHCFAPSFFSVLLRFLLFPQT